MGGILLACRGRGDTLDLGEHSRASLRAMNLRSTGRFADNLSADSALARMARLGLPGRRVRSRPER